MGSAPPLVMSFSSRLKEERTRLRLSQAQMAEVGGVSLNSQSNYENGHRAPDAEYLERLASIDVDVHYLFTGHRVLMQGYVAPEPAPKRSPDEYQPRHFQRAAQVVGETPGHYVTGASALMREVTPEEAALLDNYNAADEKGRAAARGVLDALAQSKKRANG